jgi:hypothetical protein
MARLIDWIHAKGIRVPDAFVGDMNVGAMDGFLEAIDDAISVVADNVLPHYFDAEDKGLDHMPSLMPPFQPTWVEARLGGQPFGLLYMAWGTTGSKFPKPTSASSVAIALLFGMAEGHQPYGPIMQLDIPLDGRGYFMPEESDRLSRSSDATQVDLYNPAIHKDKETRKKYAVMIKDWWGHGEVGEPEFNWNLNIGFEATKALLFAIGMMNCSNVGTVEVEPSKRLSKKREKRYGTPLARYKVIQVRPHLTARSRPHSDSERTVSEGTPLHICRGHFKTYEEDRPLLGRHTGTFWWKAQVRGAKEHGEIVHEYEVE